MSIKRTDLPPPALFAERTHKTANRGGLLSYEQFLRKVRRYPRSTALREIAEASWQAWNGECAAEEDEMLQRAYASRVCALLAAEAPTSVRKQPHQPPISLLHDFLRIEETFSIEGSGARFAEPLLQECLKTGASSLVSSTQQARRAQILFSLSRVIRTQWQSRLTDPDGLARTWWCLKRLDQLAGIMGALRKRLGMDVPTFVQSSRVLFALAMTGDSKGQIDLEKDFSSLESKWDVPNEVVRLAARKLSVDFETIGIWHRDIVLANSSQGYFQHCSTPLLAAPLIEVPDGVEPAIVCPSPDGFVAATERYLRVAATSCPGQITENVNSVFGEVLEDYIVFAVKQLISDDAVHKIDKWEHTTEKQADLLLVEGSSALIVEIKRTLANQRERSVQDEHGIASILAKLCGAYEQCRTSADRRPWEREQELGGITTIAAIIVLDDVLAAEGDLFARLIRENTEHALPVAVVGVAELEMMICTLGIAGVVELVEKRFSDDERCDLPLRTYASRTGLPPRSTQAIRDFLAEENKELFGDLQGDARATRWP